MITKDDAKKLNVKVIENNLDEKTKLTELLKQNFPSTFKDGALDQEAIAMILGVSQKVSGYELTWTGKALANALYQAPAIKELSLQSGEINSPNSIIIGDNLDALKILSSAYYEKIKMIYIDPPYNTKSDDFLYKDNYREDYKDILRKLNLLYIDENGKEVESDSLNFIKNIQSTKSHSGWLSFMLPRLKLARDLLKEDGVIFISIDDHEMANLKLLCDEIFGEENFVANIIWQKSYSPINLKKHFSNSHDYVICYAKQIDILVCNGLERSEEANARYINPDNDSRGLWKPATLQVGPAVESNIYEIESPSGKKFLPPSNYSWMFSKDRYFEMLKDNRIYFGENGNNTPCLKRFLSEVKNSITPMTNWHYKEVGHQQDAMRDLKKMFNKKVVFDYPKPVKLIKQMINLYTNPNDDDIILDFFAGSATTAHAVMEQNLEDGGNRKFILVQLDESIDPDKSKVAYDFCKNELHSANPIISDITIERVKRAALKLKSDMKFNTYTMPLKEGPTIKDGHITLPLSTLSSFDIARNMLLSYGKGLDATIKELIKGQLFICDELLVIVKSDRSVIEKIKEYKNSEVILNGYDDIGFDDFKNLEVIAGERLRVAF